jgi:hypothetical protein
LDQKRAKFVGLGNFMNGFAFGFKNSEKMKIFDRKDFASVVGDEVILPRKVKPEFTFKRKRPVHG